MLTKRKRTIECSIRANKHLHIYIIIYNKQRRFKETEEFGNGRLVEKDVKEDSRN